MAGWFSEWMHTGCWLLWSFFSLIFLHFLLFVFLCLILPASSSSVLSSILFSSLEEELLCLLSFPVFTPSHPLSLFLIFYLFPLILSFLLAFFSSIPIPFSPFNSLFSILLSHLIVSVFLSVSSSLFIYRSFPYFLYLYFHPMNHFKVPFCFSLTTSFSLSSSLLSCPPLSLVFLPLSTSLSLPACFSALPLFLCLLF